MTDEAGGVFGQKHESVRVLATFLCPTESPGTLVLWGRQRIRATHRREQRVVPVKQSSAGLRHPCETQGDRGVRWCARLQLPRHLLDSAATGTNADVGPRSGR